VSDDYSGTPPEPPIEPEPVARPRTRVPTVLFMFALIGIAGGGYWFATQLKPHTPSGGAASAAVAAPDTLVPDSVQIIHPRHIVPANAQITAADLPGFDCDGLTPGQIRWLYHKAHLEQCSCGCGWNVAECRINDPNCPKSPQRSKEMVAEAKLQKL
jgi:hypothetical protein